MVCLWSIVQLFVKEKQKYFSLLYRQLTESLTLVYGFDESTARRCKSLCNWTCRNQVTCISIYHISYISIYLNISQVFRKVLVTYCFFSDKLEHKCVNKINFRTSSANICQLCGYYLENCLTGMIIIWGFQDFLIYLAKCFSSILNFPNKQCKQIKLISIVSTQSCYNKRYDYKYIINRSML